MSKQVIAMNMLKAIFRFIFVRLPLFRIFLGIIIVFTSLQIRSVAFNTDSPTSFLEQNDQVNDILNYIEDHNSELKVRVGAWYSTTDIGKLKMDMDIARDELFNTMGK